MFHNSWHKFHSPLFELNARLWHCVMFFFHYFLCWFSAGTMNSSNSSDVVLQSYLELSSFSRIKDHEHLQELLLCFELSFFCGMPTLLPYTNFFNVIFSQMFWTNSFSGNIYCTKCSAIRDLERNVIIAIFVRKNYKYSPPDIVWAARAALTQAVPSLYKRNVNVCLDWPPYKMHLNLTKLCI